MKRITALILTLAAMAALMTGCQKKGPIDKIKDRWDSPYVTVTQVPSDGK